MPPAKKKGISISLVGTEVPVYFPDDSAVKLKITPNTTAGAAIQAIRAQIGLERDAHYSMYEYLDGQFLLIDDKYQLAKLLLKWPQDSPFGGPRKLYFKRSLFIPGTKTDVDEVAAPTTGASAPGASATAATGTGTVPPVPVLAPIATPSSSSSAAVSAASASSASASAASAAASRPTAAQRCAFADALFNYTHSRYRFDTPDIVRLAALLLYLWRGNYRPSADSVPVLRSFIPDLCPPYAILDSAADHPRSYGMGKASSAVSATDMAVSIQSEYAGLHPAFSPADAAAQFVHICRQSPLYGHEFFTAKRTWKEAEEAGDGSVREVQHTEDVMMAVGHEGFLLLGMEDPLAVTTYDYGELIRWTTSRDGKIFAFSLEDRIVYIVTDDAPYIVRTTDRYVEERVRHMQAAEGGAGDAPPAEVDSSATPRSDKTPGLGPVPTVTGTLEAPRPRFSRPDLPAPPCVVHIGTASRSSHSGFSPSVSSRSLLARSVVSDGMHSGASSVLEGGAGASVCTTPAVTITEVMAAQLLGNPASPGGDAGGGGGAGAGGGAGELPEGWVQLTDSDGDVYYYCEATGQTSWEPPPRVLPADPPYPLPPGWAAAVDEASGELYFYNEDTGESSWERPGSELIHGLPHGWTVDWDEEGDVYYIHEPTGKTSWYRPDPDGVVREPPDA